MWLEGLSGPPERVRLSPAIADETLTTTCYMCACRCGIKVHLKDGKVRYIEGNRDHPVNRGVLCAKGSAGIMQHYSPARLTRPLKRVGRRGDGEFEEIEWEDALAMLAERLAAIRAEDPRKLAFFTGRDQSQGLTGFWATQFGTPNYAAHGGFCSVNMAAGGLYTVGGSFWEFGEPDWDHARYFLMFGVAEDHDSNPIKIGLSKLKRARREVRLRQPGAHRLFGDRRRVGRHPPRHGRAADPRALPRIAAHRPHRSAVPGPLHQRQLAGAVRTILACSRAEPTASRSPGTSRPAAPSMPAGSASARRSPSA